MKKLKRLLIQVSIFSVFISTALATQPTEIVAEINEEILKELDFVEMTEEELDFGNQNKGLARSPINRDPVSGRTYSHRIAGPFYTISGNSLGNWIWDFVTGADSRIFMRYITLYNKSRRYKKDLSAGPDAVFNRIVEPCHVNSIFMGEWSRGNNLTVRLEAGIGMEQMGLSASVKASVEEGISFTNTVRVQAVGQGFSAVHKPMMYYRNYEGVTLAAIYVVNQSGQKVRRGYLTSRLPSQYITNFRTRYPYRFRLTHQDRGFGDEITNVREYPRGCQYGGVRVSQGRVNQMNNQVMGSL